MKVFIYFNEPLTVARDEIEDAIEVVLNDKGEVTGGGSGNLGSNIDVEVFDESLDEVKTFALIQSALRRFRIPKSTSIVIDGTRYQMAPSNA
ncbi:MAG TPA: hypothetical protein VM008_21785 [Phycisphaerae bacterium]|nr:hypothetical protein [Phycisphaerae bacterium]